MSLQLATTKINQESIEALTGMVKEITNERKKGSIESETQETEQDKIIDQQIKDLEELDSLENNSLELFEEENDCAQMVSAVEDPNNPLEITEEDEYSLILQKYIVPRSFVHYLGTIPTNSFGCNLQWASYTDMEHVHMLCKLLLPLRELDPFVAVTEDGKYVLSGYSIRLYEDLVRPVEPTYQPMPTAPPPEPFEQFEEPSRHAQQEQKELNLQNRGSFEGAFYDTEPGFFVKIKGIKVKINYKKNQVFFAKILKNYDQTVDELMEMGDRASVKKALALCINPKLKE